MISCVCGEYSFLYYSERVVRKRAFRFFSVFSCVYLWFLRRFVFLIFCFLEERRRVFWFFGEYFGLFKINICCCCCDGVLLFLYFCRVDVLVELEFFFDGVCCSRFFSLVFCGIVGLGSC